MINLSKKRINVKLNSNNVKKRFKKMRKAEDSDHTKHPGLRACWDWGEIN